MIEYLQDSLDDIYRYLQEEDENNTGVPEESEVIEYPFWYVGVMLYSAGAFFLALGVVLQKFSINKELKKAHYTGGEMKSKIKQPLWVLGIILYGSSGGLLSAALAFAAQSQVTPLMSLVIISNAVLARFLLGEPLTKRDFYCVILIVIAVVLTTSAAPTTQTKKSTEQLLDLYKEPLFIGFIICLLSFMGSLYAINKYTLNLKKNHEKLSKRQEFLFSFSYGASAGCWGGLCVTMIKSALTIIQDKATEGLFLNIFIEPIVYILLGILITCWYQQLNWINKGLERFPAVFIVSIEAVVNEVVAVSGGLIYFQEYLEFDAVTGPIFGGGLLLGVIGVMIFALRDNDVGPESDFFTQNNWLQCCKCCFLNMDEEGHGLQKSRTIKTFTNQGSMVFVNEKGEKILEPEKEDQVQWEQVDSPLKILGDGATKVVKTGLKSVFESLTYIEPVEGELYDEDGKEKKGKLRFSVSRAVTKARTALLRAPSQPEVAKIRKEEDDDASTVPPPAEEEQEDGPSVKPSL